MKKLWRRLASLLLVSILVFSTVPAAALAEFGALSAPLYAFEDGGSGLDAAPAEGGAAPRANGAETLNLAGEWAVILYMCGSDIESGSGNMSQNLVNFLKMDLPAGLNIVAITGGAKAWDPLRVGVEFNEAAGGAYYIKPSTAYNEIFWIQPKDSETGFNQMVRLTPEPNTGSYTGSMGDDDTAIALLNDPSLATLFKSEHIMLVFEDHGGAWTGAAVDEKHNNDALDLPELRNIVKAAAERHGKKLDIVGYDACLMSGLEVAWFMKDYADYMVASEEVEYSPGWRYDFLNTNAAPVGLHTTSNDLPGSWPAGKNGKEVGAVELGTAIIDTYIKGVQKAAPFLSATMALTDLSKVKELAATFENLAGEIINQIWEDLYFEETEEGKLYTYAQVARAAESTQAMHPGQGMIDLYDFMVNLQNGIKAQEVYNAAQAVINALGTPPKVTPPALSGSGDGVAYYTGRTIPTGGKSPAVLYRGTCYRFYKSVGLAVFYPLISFGEDPMEKLKSSGCENVFEEMKLDNYMELAKLLTVEESKEVLSFDGKLVTVYPDNDEFAVAIDGPTNALKRAEILTAYTDEYGTTYLMGSDIVPGWEGVNSNGTLSFQPYEEWFGVAVGNDTLPVTVMTNGEYVHTEAGYDYYSYTVPVKVKFKDKIKLNGLPEVEATMGVGWFQPANGDGVAYYSGLTYTCEYKANDGQILTASVDIPLSYAEAVYPGVVKWDSNALKKGDVLYWDGEDGRPKIKLTFLYEDVITNLKKDKMGSSGDGYYASYFQVTDLLGKTHLSDPYPYLIMTSFKDFYLGVMTPRIVDSNGMFTLGEGDIRVMSNGYDVTAAVLPGLDYAKLAAASAAGQSLELPNGVTVRVDVDRDKTPKVATLTVRVEFNEDPSFKEGDLQASFALCENGRELAKAYMELLGGAYVEPFDGYIYGNPNTTHDFGDDCGSLEAYEHVRIVEALRVLYAWDTLKDCLEPGDVDKIQKAYEDVLEAFNADFKDSESGVELLGAVSVYGFIPDMQFRAERDADKSGVSASVANSSYYHTYHMTIKRGNSAVPPVAAEHIALEIKLPEDVDTSNMKLYYARSASGAWTELEQSYQMVYVITERDDGKYLVLAFFGDVNDYYFLLCPPLPVDSGSGTGGGGIIGGSLWGDSSVWGGAGASAAKPETPAKPTTPTTPTTPAASSDSAARFTDVSPDSVYYDAIDWAVKNGVTNGTGGATFSPDSPCTRAQIVTFLWRAKGSPAPASTVNPFTDVDESSPYYRAILWAVENGITNGTGADTFDPGAACTRAQAVTLQWRAAGEPAASGLGGFGDVNASGYYAGAVAWAVNRSITNGTSATTFEPDTACTRAQIVTFLYRDLA